MKTLKQILIFRSIHKDLLFWGLFLVFFLIRIYSIHVPGLYADEIYVPYVALQTKLQVPSLHPPFVNIFGYKLPLGISPQSGGFPIYPQLLLLLLTENPFAHRVLSVVYACIFILFFYSFMKSFLNRKVALLSVLILTFMPSHIFYSRTDPYFILRLSIMSFMFYTFHRWYLQKGWKYFYMGCLAIGLGLSTRLEMVMFVIAFPIYLIFFNIGLLKNIHYLLRENLIRTVNGLILLFLGAFFYILFNLYSGYNILSFFKHESLLKKADVLIAFLTNIGVRIDQIRDFFNCGNPFLEIEGNFCSFIPFYIMILFWLIVTGVLIVKRFKGFPNRKIEFLAAMSILIFLQSIPSTSLSPFHNLIILPLLVGIFSYGLSLAPRILILILVAVLLAIYIPIDVKYYKNLRAFKESPLWSSTVFDLVENLKKEKVNKILAGDWGISRLIFYASKGEITSEEIFGYSDDANSFIRKLEDEYKKEDNIYIFYLKGTVFNRIDPFKRFITEKKIPYNEVFVSNRSGEPIYAIYRLKGEK